MNKKLLICLIVLVFLCAGRTINIVNEIDEWAPYVSKEKGYDSLVYSFRNKRYNDLYEMVLINEIIDDSKTDELYDFAHYYHELTVAHKNYLNNKDYAENLDNMKSYEKNISTKDILLAIEELKQIYSFDN